MDPALQELIEGEADEEIEAIIRLEPGRPPPPHVRIIAQFGEIATCRLPRRRIAAAWADSGVISLKAARVFGVDPDPIAAEGPLDVETHVEPQPGDTRRPAWLPETGRGVVVGVIDWGFDFAHPNFRNPDGSTRALALWDQSAPGPGPLPYGYGRVFQREEINRALRADDPYTTLGYHPASGDPTGRGSHGTHVLDIAAGNGRAEGSPSGMAPAADLLFVHLATRGTGGLASLGDSVTLLEGLHWMVREADARPIVINLSVGRHGGPHHGLTLVEQGIDALLSERPGRCVVQSAGNYFEARSHASGRLRPGQRRFLTWWTEQADLTPNELEIWYPGEDVFGIEVAPPDGSPPIRIPLGSEAGITIRGQEVGRIYHRARDPAAGDNHVDLFLYTRAPPGSWIVTLSGDDVVDGRWHAWVERDAGCPFCQSRLDEEDADPGSTTGTIANGFRALAVGACDAHDPGRSLARFSSSGPTRDGRSKPDLVAPGVRVLAARSAPRAPVPAPVVFRQSGTSMAAPHVTGTVALLFEAAGTLLPVQETRRLLLSTARPHPDGAATERWGNGILDVEAAVAAARQWGTKAVSEIAVGFADSEVEETMSHIGEETSYAECRGHEAEMDSAEPDGHFLESLLDQVRWSGNSPFTPANLFDAALRGGAAWQTVASAFEVVALPGTLPRSVPRPGDLLVRRALGEGNLADLRLVTPMDSIGTARLPLDRLVLRPRIGALPDVLEQVLVPDSTVANRFVAAHARRFCRPGQRGSATCARIPSPRPVRRVIIHVLGVPSSSRRSGVEAVVAGWQTGRRAASAHYLVDRDGTITQMVRETDVAFHTPGNNSDSLGIEHADVCNDPAPLTPALYQRSAELVRDLAARHGFALDATTVMGHRDAMPNHGDPGSYWDWEYYRQLLAWDGTTQQTRPVRVVAAAASLATTPAGWQVRQRRAIANHQCASRRDPWGERYWRARPTASGDAADITATVDQAGRYRVSLWWPAVPGANSEVPLEIEVAGGSRHNVNLDQRLNSGRWNDVVEADVPAAPCEVRVRFRRNASRPGWIVADAVRLLRIGPVQGAGELVETTDASTLPILRLGARGEPVRQLQTALGTHGLELQTDGSFGPLTHAAVQLFQRLYYLKPDGIVGPLTWRALLDRPYGDLRTAADLVAEFAEQSPLQKILPADFEMPSWVFPQTKGTPALLGMIFFPTNQVDLDAGDKQQLDRLVDIIAAQTTSYFPGDPNRPLVMLPGHADPRTTTRKGGNEQLSIDRSASVLRYLTTELDRRDAAKGNDPGTWRGKVAFESYGVGVDPALKKLAPGYPFMRMVALVRTRGDDFVLRDVPAATCAEAKARAREVLRKSPGSFLKEELRRLTHMCRDRTTEDGFLKFDDPQFIKEVHGASKKLWSEDELDRFMNRHRFCGHLQRFAGPTARDQDVIGVLHYLHGTMAAAIFEMHKAQIIADATKDYAPVPNQHRKQLINRVADGTRNPKSVYFNFGPVSGSQFEVLEEEEEEQEEAIPAGPLLEASPTAPPCAGAATILGRFPTAKTTLNQEQRAMVESLARDIAASQGSETPVQSVCVVGHTDSAGNAEQNLELGATRARAAETELRAALDRIQPGLSGRLSFSRDSRGESSPAASNATEDGRALNRRVEITLGRAERIAAPHIEPADAETPLTTEGFAEQAATGPFVVPTGTAGRVFLTRRGGPFLEWSTSDPTIARVSPISDSQALPNQTTVFGLRPGTTELRVRARSARGASGFATVRIVVSGAELSLHAPDGRVEVGSGELVRPVPAVPNGVAERIVAVQLHPASFWSGKQVMWQFQDQAGVRGALPAGRSRLEAVPGADFTPATRQSVVAADGTARVRIAMPSVAFNRGQLTVSAVDSNLVGATVPLEVPGIVAIDPGHGGGFQIFRRIGGQCREDSSSNNATGIATGTLEKDLTLDLAFRVREALGRSPRLLRVFLSRDTDVNLPLSDRARFARFKGADIMLCIHFNAAEQNGAPDPGPHGPVVFIRRANSNVNLAEDRALADRISARLRALRPSNRADHVVEAGFAVLNDPDLGNNQGHHPSRAVLLETDFLTNQAADQFFGNANNRSTIANAIAEALMEDLALQP